MGAAGEVSPKQPHNSYDCKWVVAGLGQPPNEIDGATLHALLFLVCFAIKYYVNDLFSDLGG